jgi:hypothetical protein
MVKDLTFRDAQKSSQECENTGVKTDERGALQGSDRESEGFAEEMDSLTVFAKSGDPNTQKCGAGQGCEGLIVTSMIQVAAEITRSQLDERTELVHVQSHRRRANALGQSKEPGAPTRSG